MRKYLMLGLLVVGCSEESSCFDTLTCPPVDTTTAGGTAGTGSNTGGTAGTGNSGGAGSGGTISTGGSGGSSGGGSGGAGGTTGGTGAIGGTGGGGMGGSSGAPGTCDDACGGSTPVCDEAADTCVQCLDSDEHCEAPTPACDPESRECVECLDSDDCNTGVCDTEAQRCVECLGSEDCETPTPLCDTEAQLCVECLGNGDCQNTLEAFCDAGSCSPCLSNADCNHLTDTTVCDTGAGQCVECTGTDYESCGLNDDDEQRVCDSLSRTCSDQVEAGSGACGACVSDAECQTGMLCIRERHLPSGTDLGWICAAQPGVAGVSEFCSDGPPYVQARANLTSIDGEGGTVCALAVSTCLAHAQFRSSSVACETEVPDVLDDDACGEPSVGDGGFVRSTTVQPGTTVIGVRCLAARRTTAPTTSLVAYPPRLAAAVSKPVPPAVEPSRPMHLHLSVLFAATQPPSNPVALELRRVPDREECRSGSQASLTAASRQCSRREGC